MTESGGGGVHVKRSYTTGEVARICGVSARTVVNYCNQGKIGSLRSSVTGYRRIPHDALLGFMREHGIDEAGLLEVAPPRILVAEDRPADRRYLVRVLARAFAEAAITEAVDGYEALIKTGADRPDLLVLDLRMPAMDGLEVCRRLKEAEATRDVRILAVTAYDEPGLEARLLDAGAGAYLRKDGGRYGARLVEEAARLLGIEPVAAQVEVGGPDGEGWKVG